jgi:hypothetical protein
MAQTADYEVMIEGKTYPWDEDTISVRYGSCFPGASGRR